jgi:hypothetical protein
LRKKTAQKCCSGSTSFECCRIQYRSILKFRCGRFCLSVRVNFSFLNFEPAQINFAFNVEKFVGSVRIYRSIYVLELYSVSKFNTLIVRMFCDSMCVSFHLGMLHRKQCIVFTTLSSMVLGNHRRYNCHFKECLEWYGERHNKTTGRCPAHKLGFKSQSARRAVARARDRTLQPFTQGEKLNVDELESSLSLTRLSEKTFYNILPMSTIGVVSISRSVSFS